MSLSINEKIAIMDGTAEKELEATKLQIAVEHQRHHDQQIAARRARATVAERIGTGGVLPTVAALANVELREFRDSGITNAIRDEIGGVKGNTLMREISASLCKDVGISAPEHGGILVPLRINAAGLDTKSNGAGAYLTAPKIQDIEDALRNQTKVFDLGVRFITGVKASPAWPVESNVTAASWVAQNPGSDNAASDPSYAQRVMSPRALAACTSVSRQLLGQSSSDIEGWIRQRIALAHGIALDRACIHGSGASNEPVGILATANIGNVAIGAAGGSPTCDFINSLEAAVGAANTDSPTCGFLTNSVMRSRLRKNPQMTSGTLPLWTEGNTMLSHRAEVSNQVRSDLVKGASSDCSAIIYGDWSQLIVCEFGGVMEIVIDPFTARKQNLVEIASWGMYDVLLLQPTAMAAILDARNV